MDMYMTKLDPNKKYVYERVDNRIYAREVGSLDRILMSDHSTFWDDRYKWMEIITFARTSPMLQQELDRVIMLYYLLQQDKPIQHHPV